MFFYDQILASYILWLLYFIYFFPKVYRTKWQIAYERSLVRIFSWWVCSNIYDVFLVNVCVSLCKIFRTKCTSFFFLSLIWDLLFLFSNVEIATFQFVYLVFGQESENISLFSTGEIILLFSSPDSMKIKFASSSSIYSTPFCKLYLLMLSCNWLFSSDSHHVLVFWALFQTFCLFLKTLVINSQYDSTNLKTY